MRGYGVERAEGFLLNSLVMRLTKEGKEAMIIGRPEALDLFRKWKSERSLLRCVFEFKGFAASLRARVFLVGDSEIRLVSDFPDTELVVSLREVVDFSYVEPFGRFREEDAETAVSALGLGFRAPEGEEDRDLIKFIELVEDRP